MSFQPVVPLGGLAGWRFLERTQERQSLQFARSPELTRATAYFRDNIGSVRTARQLVLDRRLLLVALGAFGLDADLDKKFFIRKILEEGTADPRAMANRLSDKRYRRLAGAFAFDNPAGPAIRQAGFADRIIAAYKTRQFEIAVGKSDPAIRLAMNFKREIRTLAANDKGDKTGWYVLLASPPMRKVVEGALGLPRQIAALDIDRQVDILKSRFRTSIGVSRLSQFADNSRIERVIQKFLAREAARGNTAQRPGSTALTLLQETQSGFLDNGAMIESLIASKFRQ